MFVDFTQQCFAFTPFSKLSRLEFEFSLKVMRSNPGYPLKPFLLYLPRIILSLVITLALADFCVLTTRWRTLALVVLTILAYPF